jgi:hypothetical protein
VQRLINGSGYRTIELHSLIHVLRGISYESVKIESFFVKMDSHRNVVTKRFNKPFVFSDFDASKHPTRGKCQLSFQFRANELISKRRLSKKLRIRELLFVGCITFPLSVSYPVNADTGLRIWRGKRDHPSQLGDGFVRVGQIKHVW